MTDTLRSPPVVIADDTLRTVTLADEACVHCLLGQMHERTACDGTTDTRKPTGEEPEMLDGDW